MSVPSFRISRGFLSAVQPSLRRSASLLGQPRKPSFRRSLSRRRRRRKNRSPNPCRCAPRHAHALKGPSSIVGKLKENRDDNLLKIIRALVVSCVTLMSLIFARAELGGRERLSITLHIRAQIPRVTNGWQRVV